MAAGNRQTQALHVEPAPPVAVRARRGDRQIRLSAGEPLDDFVGGTLDEVELDAGGFRAEPAQQVRYVTTGLRVQESQPHRAGIRVAYRGDPLGGRTHFGDGAVGVLEQDLAVAVAPQA